MAKGKRTGKKRSQPGLAAKKTQRPGSATTQRSPEPARSGPTRARSTASARRPASAATIDRTIETTLPAAESTVRDWLPVVGMVAFFGNHNRQAWGTLSP